MKVVVQPSPNHSDRGGVTVDTIMLHSTGGGLEGSLNWLTNPESKVSAHYLISRDGTIYKLVPVQRSAWHAGKCRVQNANARSIGIEMEQKPKQQWTEEQADVLKRLIRILVRAVPTIKYLVGHREWTTRKTDPYGIDMDAWRRESGLGVI